MIESDTIRLLREVDAGIRMGTDSIHQVLGKVKSEKLERILVDCRAAHEALGQELEAALHRFHDEGKSANPMAKTMSRMKTGIELALDESDATIADLMTDGCDMGVKSLSRYLNQYRAADESAKALCRKLIALEEELGKELRAFL